MLSALPARRLTQSGPETPESGPPDFFKKKNLTAKTPRRQEDKKAEGEIVQPMLVNLGVENIPSIHAQSLGRDATCRVSTQTHCPPLTTIFALRIVRLQK